MNKETLNRMYWEEGKSLVTISKELGKSPSTLQYLFAKLGIPLRKRYEAARLLTGRGKPNFESVPEKDWELLAWVIAAEGSIGFKTYNRLMPMVGVGNSKMEFIEALMAKFPNLGSIYSSQKGIKSTKLSRGKPFQWEMHEWSLTTQSEVLEVMKHIIPYLPLKQERARCVRDFCELRLQHPAAPYTEEEVSLAWRVKELNRKGGNRNGTI